MHITTHILSGWLCGNTVPSFSTRERFFCMIAAFAPDIDGLSIIGGREFYYDWHHVLLHNLLFAVVFSGLLCWFSKNKFTAFMIYLGILHLHFLMDLLGSGEGWGIEYWQPFSSKSYMWEIGWDFLSWQNYLVAVLCIVGSFAIIIWKKRTILEYPMPNADKELSNIICKFFKHH